MRTSDTMTEIDGMRLDSPAFALTVSDAMLPDQTEERLEILAMLSEATGRLRFVRVRDDAMDSGMFIDTAVSAASLGLGLILESDVPSNLLAAAEALPGRRPLLMSPNGDQKGIVGIAASLGCPVLISCPVPEDLPGLLLLASGLGCEDVAVDPCAVSMKGCLESTVRTARMMVSGDIPEAPIACRGWSGEYALSMASVSVLSGGTLAILDDLDIQSCRVLGMLMDGIRPVYFRSGRSVKAFNI